jgi:pteridine reductase
MNKRILITGAAKRIGKEMALSFFNKGWDIVIHYNSSKEEAEALAHKMNSERSNSAMLVQANLDNANEVEKLAEKILSKNGSIDALINNASTFYPTPVGTFSEENWNALMGSNLKAPLFLIQSLHKELEKNKGFIINVTDINVDKGFGQSFNLSCRKIWFANSHKITCKRIGSLHKSQCNSSWCNLGATKHRMDIRTKK